MIYSFWGGSIRAWPKDFISLGYRCCIDRFVIANSSEELWKHQVRILFRLSKGDAIFLFSWAQVCCAIPLVLWSPACTALCWRALGASLIVRGQHPALVLPGSAPSPRARPGLPWHQSLPRTVGFQQAAHSPGGFPIVLQSLELQQLLQGGASSWEHLPAVPTAELTGAEQQLPALPGKVSWECLTKLKGRLLYKKTQPPCVACFYTSNHLSVVQFFLWCLC